MLKAWIDREDALNVVIDKANLHLTLDFNGQIIDKTKIDSPDKWDALAAKASNANKDNLGNT